MSKAKTTTIFNIIGNGTKLYFQNLVTLSAPVIMPLLGILLGIALMIFPVYLFPKFYPNWAEALPILKELYAFIILIIIAELPGLIVFKLGFWNYLLRMVSLNVMVGDIMKKKVLKHHSHYSEIVALRSKDYLLMLLIWCMIILMGLALPFAVFLFNIEPVFLPYLFIGFEFLAVFLLTILSIYLSLSFQVFAFETGFGPMQTLEESFRLVLNNFWRIVLLLLSLTVITSVLVPQIFAVLTDILMIKNTIALPVKVLLENILENYSDFYTNLQTSPLFVYDSQEKFIAEFSKMLSFGFISMVISLLMLPMGSCFYTLFYFDAQKRHSSTEEPQEETVSTKSKKTKKK